MTDPDMSLTPPVEEPDEDNVLDDAELEAAGADASDAESTEDDPTVTQEDPK